MLNDLKEVVIPYPFEGEVIGGIQRVIQAVTSEIDEISFTVLTPEPHEEIYSVLDVEFDTFDKKMPWWGVDYRRPSIKKRLNNYDLIWNHSLMLNDLVANSETPAVTTFHSIEHPTPAGIPTSVSEFKERVEWRLLMRGFYYLSQCERVVAVSDRSKNVVERGTGANVVRIYNGTDYLGSAKNTPDNNYIFSADRPVAAVYVAGKTGFPAKILGKNPRLERVAEELGADVEFIDGFVTDEELKELYKNCSFYISGSYTDGFGLTPLEANQFSKPCVVFDKEVHSENIEEGVNGFKAANIKQMIDKSRKLKEDEDLRKEMGEPAYEYAQKFNWDDAADQYREEFLSVMTE